jgi:hypothetical protein
LEVAGSIHGTEINGCICGVCYLRNGSTTAIMKVARMVRTAKHLNRLEKKIKLETYAIESFKFVNHYDFTTRSEQVCYGFVMVWLKVSLRGRYSVDVS